MFGAYAFGQAYLGQSPSFETVVVIPPEVPPITAPGGGRGGKAKRKRQYQIAESADPQRPYATRLEPVGYEAPVAWAPAIETESHEEDEMLMLLAVFG
jgi:hypothetical protein